MVCLPGGQVVPEDRREMWEGARDYVSLAPSEKVTKAQLRKKMLDQ
jgi:hypothetical protein